MSLLATENKFADLDEAATPTSAVQSTALTETPINALATKSSMTNVLMTLKDAVHVDYNTLEQVIPNQGSFLCRESKKVLGDEITFEVLSFQDSYVVSPEDDKAPDTVVRYSEDGKICSDGTDVADHFAWLRANGYPSAKMKQRVVVVAALLATTKSKDMEGSLVQLDLSPANRIQWNRYAINASYSVKTGRTTEEKAKIVKAVAEISTAGTNTYTLAKFSIA